MTGPLVLLAAGAAGAGLLLQRSLDGGFSDWARPVLGTPPNGAHGLAAGTLAIVASAVALVTLAVAWLVYASGRIDWLALRARAAPLQRLFANGWYVDTYYAAILVAPGKAVAAFTAYRLDAGFIDGIVNGVGAGTRRLAEAGRRIQTGYVRTYALVLFAGAVGILLYTGLRA
jgi:NADH-quinone oxidoreductase subunit L